MAQQFANLESTFYEQTNEQTKFGKNQQINLLVLHWKFGISTYNSLWEGILWIVWFQISFYVSIDLVFELHSSINCIRYMVDVEERGYNTLILVETIERHPHRGCDWVDYDRSTHVS